MGRRVAGFLALIVLIPAVVVALAATLGSAPPPAAPSPIRFENVVGRSGITFRLDNSFTPERHQVETMIAGVAVFDYNNDGKLDLYFANGARLPGFDKSDPRFWNRLYRNNGDGTFTDVAEQAGVRGDGYAMGVAVGDYDNDGCEDLYVTGVNRNHLFHNNCNGTFTDVTEKAHVEGVDHKLGKTWAISAGWFDYDNDGWLDLLVVNYVKWSIDTEPPCRVNSIRAYCSPDSYEAVPNLLYHNNHDGTFTDVSLKSGIGKYAGKGMGVAFADYDGDGWMDAFVSNDTYRNFLFHNKGDGTFDEEAIAAGVAYNENGKSIAGMGADFRDVDNDGWPDIWVVGMVGDTFPLFHNDRGRGFFDITSPSGVTRATAGVTAWGAGIADFDNDGWKDLFAASAAILDNAEEIDNLPSKLPPVVLRNLDGKSFANVSPGAGASFNVPHRHRGVAFGDLDNDGRIDLVITNQDDLPDVFLNCSAARHWLIFDLTGTKSNRDGIGARIKVVAGGKTQYNHVSTSVGYSASSDRRVHFGLGAATKADIVEILWPSGIKQALHDVSADQVVKVREGAP